MGQKLGAMPPFEGGELGPHVTQCGRGWGLPANQDASTGPDWTPNLGYRLHHAQLHMAPKLFDHRTTWAGPCVGSAPLNFTPVLQIWSWRLWEPCIRWGCRCPNGNGTFRGASSPLQSIGFRELCNRVSCAKMIYTSYEVLLHKKVPFRGCDVTAAHLEGKITKKNLHLGHEETFWSQTG